MTGSTTPMAERAAWHPVHRANALLQAALLSAERPSDAIEQPQAGESLSHAIESVMRGPVNITFPQPLANRLAALAREQDDAFPAFETLMADLRSDQAPDGDGDNGDGSDEMEELQSDEPLDLERPIPRPHVQTLLEEFHRRQRHASLLVAGSIATAVLLTVGGLVLIANFASASSAEGGKRPLLRSTSVVWQPPASNASAGLRFAASSANRAAKGEPLPVPLPSAAIVSQVQTILAGSGRQIAFAPLLPPSHAGYFLIRGLPPAATFSAGRQSDSGTWLVKAEHATDLTLKLGAVAEGDYPIEVYVLQSGDAPQARRSLVLRVEPAQPTYRAEAAGEDKGWASTLLDVVPAARAAEAPDVPAEPAALRARAERLLGEGDIAAARLVLIYLAERGEGEAAYELARTFDGEVLDQIGAKGISGDLASARGWYERAARGGNAKATERLKILASLSGTGPSD
jgi:hypothetical protein